MPLVSDKTSEKIRRIENGLLPPVLIKGQNVVAMNINDRMRYYNVPGVSIAVINDFKIEWAKGYGVIKKGTHIPITPETRFQAASISKSVTTLAALQLVEQGRLNLDEPVNQKLATWEIPETSLTKKHPVTLKKILTHSAGLTVSGFGGYVRNNDPVPSLRQVLDGLNPANSDAVRVIYTPGTVFQYSGGGFEILQLLLTDVTHLPFPELMDRFVLSRLEMRSSSFDQPSLENVQKNIVASGHDSKGDAIPGDWHIYPELAAAGLWTTPSDLAKFIIEVQLALKGHSKLGLSQKLAHEMASPHLEGRGLGVIARDVDGERQFSHTGGNAGYKNFFVGYTKKGQGAVIMTNGDLGSWKKLGGEIIRAIAKEYKWNEFVVERSLVPESPNFSEKIYPELLGQYQLDPGTIISISLKNNQLFAQLTDETTDRLYPESEDRFIFLDKQIEVIFPGSPHKVDKLIWSQYGVEKIAHRLD